MYAVGFEGIARETASIVEGLLPLINETVKDAANGLGGELRARWFGAEANSVRLRMKLIEMDRFLNIRCSRLTFVQKQVGQRVDCANVEVGDIAQVQRSRGFVPSGIRIYLLTDQFMNRTRDLKVNTICHEISHRVLGTRDSWPAQGGGSVAIYGHERASQLANAHGDLAIQTAENWGIFYQELFTAQGR